MSRLKTIGFSLKVFSAMMQRLPLAYRIVVAGLALTVLLLNSLLIPGCKRRIITVRIGGGPETMIEKDDFVLKGIEMEVVRFEPMGLPFSIQPALAYWLRLGDTIAPRWRTVEHHWERKGAICSFDNNTSTANCQVCDYCNPPASLDGPPCMGLGPFGNFSDALGI